MYKKTSDNLQFSARNKKELAQLDATAFKSDADFMGLAKSQEARDNLIAQKRALELRVLAINTEFSAIANRKRFEGIWESPSKMNSLRDEREKALIEISKIETELRKIKSATRKIVALEEAERKKNFGNVFLKTAKMVLADDVYKRVLMAASLAMDEELSDIGLKVPQ